MGMLGIVENRGTSLYSKEDTCYSAPARTHPGPYVVPSHNFSENTKNLNFGD
jgi:hypothetical protein